MYKDYLKAFVNIIFPAYCFVCRKKQAKEIICEECKNKIEVLMPPFCRLCAKEIRKENADICKDCLKRKIYYDRVISCFLYKEPLVTLIHLVKYKYYDYIMEFMSLLMMDYLSKMNFSFKEYDFITSVPSHPLRIREREYNQSAILAKKISEFLKIPFKNDIIFSKKNKPSQTTLKKDLRLKNVENNFFIKKDLTDKNIIIVDDVITTGATLSECAKALKKKGANSVVALTLVKVP